MTNPPVTEEAVERIGPDELYGKIGIALFQADLAGLRIDQKINHIGNAAIAALKSPPVVSEVEAVARALCRVTRVDPDALGVDGQPRWKGWVQFAQPALTAMNLDAMREALKHWDRQATCWLGTRSKEARPGWILPAINKGRAALKEQPHG